MENLRYERKWVLDHNQYDYSAYLIKSLGFKEVYQLRQINNIYFDDLNLNEYFDSESGYFRRTKVRLRWYGELIQDNIDAALELKHKYGLLGKKDIFPCKNFSFNHQVNKLSFRSLLFSSAEDQTYINNLTGFYRPVLVNSYERRYYESMCKNFRMTLDNKITYRAFGRSYAYRHFPDLVLELKYPEDCAKEAANYISSLPFKLSRNSKYTNGIDRFFV